MTFLYKQDDTISLSEKAEKSITSIRKDLEKDSEEIEKENGTFSLVVSTEDIDEHGHQIVQKGINMERWKKNPVFLTNHENWEMPVAMGTDIETVEEDGKAVTKARGVFAKTEKGQALRELYKIGFSAASVGLGYFNSDVEEVKGKDESDEGYTRINKSNLLEISFATIPANENAVRKMADEGIEVEKHVKLGLVKRDGARQDAQETDVSVKNLLHETAEEINKKFDTFIEKTEMIFKRIDALEGRADSQSPDPERVEKDVRMETHRKLLQKSVKNLSHILENYNK